MSENKSNLKKFFTTKTAALGLAGILAVSGLSYGINKYMQNAQRERYECAAMQADSHRQWQKAADLYIKAGDTPRAAGILRDFLHQNKKADEYAGLAIQKYLDEGKIDDAAAIAYDIPKYQTLSKKLFVQAIGKHIAKQEFSEAIRIADCLQLKDLTKKFSTDAVRHYVEHNDFSYAAQFLPDSNCSPKEKQQIYANASIEAEKKGDFFSAAEFSKSAGQLDRALAFYAQVNQWRYAMSVADKLGRKKEAREYALKGVKDYEDRKYLVHELACAQYAGLDKIARELFIELSEKEEVQGDLEIAKKLALKANMPLRAQKLSELIKTKEQTEIYSSQYESEKEKIEDEAQAQREQYGL